MYTCTYRMNTLILTMSTIKLKLASDWHPRHKDIDKNRDTANKGPDSSVGRAWAL